MASRFKEYEPDRILLFPPSLQDWLPEDHLSYFISDLVDELDLSEIRNAYDNSLGGQPPYHPRMMTKLLFYSYCVGEPSSRKIEKRSYEDIPTRMLAAGAHPDHDTIAHFRATHTPALSRLFVQVLSICQEAGLVKLGHVALDGTKIKANASKHKAMSYGRMQVKEQELQEEVDRLLSMAEAVDRQEDATYGAGTRGDELPEDLRFREKRLEKIREAQAVLEAAAAEKAEAKQQEIDRKNKELEQKHTQRRGRPPTPPSGIPDDTQQYNFTDPESRIMKDGASKSFMQAYNSHIAVDQSSQIIVAAAVTQDATDHHQLIPMVEQTISNTGSKPGKLTGDSGFYSDDNVAYLEEQKIDGYLAVGKEKHSKRSGPCPRGRPPQDLTVKERMGRKLMTLKGRAVYGKRKEIVEAPFGQIKERRGFRQFLRRGLEKANAEWNLICMTHNILKIFRSGYTVRGQ